MVSLQEQVKIAIIINFKVMPNSNKVRNKGSDDLVIHYLEFGEEILSHKRKPTKHSGKISEWYQNDPRSDEEIDMEVEDIKIDAQIKCKIKEDKL